MPTIEVGILEVMDNFKLSVSYMKLEKEKFYYFLKIAFDMENYYVFIKKIFG